MRFVTLIIGLTLLAGLTACGATAQDEAPPLAEPGQPTLVFIYTDN